MYSIDDVQRLERAVSLYIDELNDYYTKLWLAADACDQVMGSDPNARRHIERLEDVLLQLNGVISQSEDMLLVLARDRQLAEDTMIDD